MPPRNKAQIKRDRRRIAEMYLKGALQADIGDELGLSQATVSRDIKALHNEWMELSLADIDQKKAQELAKVDDLERTYWDAWQRSCEDAETIRQEAADKKVSKIVKTSKGQAGDPRFLQGVQWCIEKRCKILGIDAPLKTDITSKGDKILVVGLGIDLDKV